MAEPNGVALPPGKPQYQFNGINSNNSSRGASPVPRAGLIPSSQLPPARPAIPTSQLPPSRGPMVGLTQKVGQLTISGQNTPNMSPSKFNASTPNQGAPQKPVFSENSSPIVPNNMESVPLNDTSSSDLLSKNIAPPQSQSSNLNSMNSHAISNSNLKAASQASQYFSQNTQFDMQMKINGPNHQSVPNGPLQGNVPPTSHMQPSFSTTQSHSLQTIRSNNPAQVPQMHPNIAKNTPSSTLSQQQPSSVGISTAPTIINSDQQLGINQPSVGISTAPTIINSTQQLGINQPSLGNRDNPSSQIPFPPHPQNQLNYPPNVNVPFQGKSNVSSVSTNFNQTTNQSQFPPQIVAQRSRYPQTFPANPSPTPNRNQGLTQGPPQFNTGLPQRTSPAQFNVPSQGGPPTSQRFDPQINYNSGTIPPTSQPNYGAPHSINGPPLLPQGKPGLAANRYPNQPQQQQPQPSGIQQLYASQPVGQYPAQGGVVQTGFNRLWRADHLDLLQVPNILPPTKVQPPTINLGQDQLNQANCSSEVFRCTVTKIPESASLLQKSRLPLGLLIHPFKDLSYLAVIQCNVIVRCRSCRTYINPFVYFVDSKRWKCNLCFRVNELPEEFQYDPVSKTYGDPSRRPEIKSSTIEYIAPAEYMLRPPQPAVYLFLLDISRLAVESGYLDILCGVLLEEIKNIPGDARTQIGFLAYDSALHFFSLAEGLNQPHEMTILDIDDVFLPTPDNLLVNLKDRMEMVEDLLRLLPKRFLNTFDGNSALGAALSVAHKMLGATGGRVSVFQAALPNIGPGAVTSREDPNQRSTAETPLLNPVNDFYKRLALECSGQQIAVDLFVVNSQYVDMATISGISRFSGGSIHHFPLFKSSRPLAVDAFQKDLRRYLTRKIGFEAVMRVRCTRGLSIHTFHGNFFVRSTDLLSLPNINPDCAFGMQVAIEENMSDSQSVCFQAALLYTSSKGERRIRVHTLCVPITNTLQDVINSADQQCIVGLLGKMAVDRSMQASLSDAREAFINAAVDVLSAYKFSLNMGNATSGLLAPECLKLLPLYIAAILKHPAFRIGAATRLDDRVKAMVDMKTQPLYLLMQQIYPDLYPIHNLELQEVVLNGEEEPVPLPPRQHLSARNLENKGAFLMDCGDQMMILVGPNVPREFLTETLGVADYNAIGDNMIEIPILNNLANQRLHQFINYLNDEKPYNVPLQILRDNSPNRVLFLERLIEDRLENSLSYHEFLQHLKTQVK